MIKRSVYITLFRFYLTKNAHTFYNLNNNYNVGDL